MDIRKYQDKDKKNLQYICIATANPAPKSQRERDILTILYNDYFTENESQNIFVAVNGDDDAIGYILCSTDYNKFKKILKKYYLPKVWKLSKIKWFLTRLEFIIDKSLIKQFPAFLHIDILDGYQRKGLGHKLMDALVTHLKEQGVKGVMLGVGKNNEKGIKFYKKYGFQEIKNLPGAVKMGLVIE